MRKLCALHVRYLHASRIACIGNVISKKMYKHVVPKRFRINLGYIIVIGNKIRCQNQSKFFFLLLIIILDCFTRC